MSSGTTQFGCPWGNIPCKCPERTSRRGVLEVSQTPYRYTQTTARPDIVCRSSTSTHILRRRHWRNIQTIHRNTTTAFNVYRHATSIEYCHSSTLSRLPCVAFRLCFRINTLIQRHDVFGAHSSISNMRSAHVGFAILIWCPWCNSEMFSEYCTDTFTLENSFRQARYLFCVAQLFHLQTLTALHSPDVLGLIIPSEHPHVTIHGVQMSRV